MIIVDFDLDTAFAKSFRDDLSAQGAIDKENAS
jgi:hypothetical protein